MERRKYTRIRLSIPASISFLQIEGCHDGAIANLSEGGCYFPFSGEFPIGERCDLTFTIGEGTKARQYKFKGTIVRQDPDGVGVSFDDESDTGNTTLDRVREILAYYDMCW